ncbi:MAG: triose-phosphate isomerase [Chlamydiia bacterium]|nr:triose-phosphate isomerase [Chlamydiia bacterium]
MEKCPYVIGNWKMHKTAREAVDCIETLASLIAGCHVNLFLATSFTSLAQAVQASKGTQIIIGAQNMHEAREGAFTGEISSLMLKEAGASFVMLGHSERRALFGETDQMVKQKVARALQDDLIPVLCIGETLAERESGKTEKVLKRQLESALGSLPAEDALKVLLAYEPIWAIGTGSAANPQQAQEVHSYVRSLLGHLFSARKAREIPLLYGGSVHPENAHHLIAEGDVDGLLVGGSSLDPQALAAIVRRCAQSTSITREKKS